MNFLVYVFLFMLLNVVLSVNPFLGILLYVCFIIYIVSSQRKRMQFFQQQAYGQRNQQAYTNTNTNEEDMKKVKDAIDVEFTEEEI